MRPGTISVAALLSPLPILGCVQSNALQPIFTSSYSPRRSLYFAHRWLLWTNVLSDVLTIASYALFFIGICLLIRKIGHIEEIRKYLWVFIGFRVFILACAVSILIRIVNIWFPLYQFSIALKIVCAAASIPTAVLFVWQSPHMAASVVRFFDLLGDEQQRVERLRKSEEFLDRIGRIAGIGGWEVNLITKKVTWSPETYRIHGLPLDYIPTIEAGLERYAPEARPTIIAAVTAAASGGPGWDLELPLDREDGRRIWVRVLGAADFHNGKPVRLIGAFQDITDRVAEREALKQANERIEIATQSGGIGIWDWDILAGKLFCDDQMHRLHGKDPLKPEVDGLWRDHVHPDDKERVVTALDDAVNGIAPYDTEFRVVWPDGSVHYLRGSARVARDENGTPVRMVGVNWDVTARVQAENALRHANERVTLATDSGAIGIYDWNIQTDLCTADPWMHRLWDMEYTGEPCPLSAFAERIHPEDRADVIEALEDGIAGRRPYNMEFRVVWKNGSIRHIRANGQVTRDESGRAVRMVGVNTDVTEARDLTAELAQQHELLRVTLQSIGDGVITTDAQRNVAWLNPAAERMTGWFTTDAIGLPLSHIFRTMDGNTRKPLENPLAHRLAQGAATGIAKHTLLVSQNGGEIAIENSVAPIRNHEGELLGNVLVFRDVTEQRRLTAETERVNKLQVELKTKDEFLSHVSHELRSPLTSIYSFTSIITDGLAGETTPEQHEYLQIVLKNVVQLQAMIEDLLTVTQTREGKLSIELQSVSTAEAVADAMHTIQGAAAVKKVALSSNHHASLPNACADPTRLRQVLIILLDNAVKFTPCGGSISVTVSRSDPGFLLVQVTDTGCGIALDKRALVFENLYQVTGPEQPDTSQQGRIGLGLGLHIARDLVTRQGGRIWITGEPDHGSTFNFTLPVYSEETLAANAALARGVPRRRKTDRQPQLAPELSAA
jgi:PAS domain S-box-containing protein